MRDLHAQVMLALIVVSYTFAIVRAVYLALLHVLRPNSHASLEDAALTSTAALGSSANGERGARHRAPYIIAMENIHRWPRLQLGCTKSCSAWWRDHGVSACPGIGNLAETVCSENTRHS